jgi:hypothetical protein
MIQSGFVHRMKRLSASPGRGKDPTPALHPKSGLPDFGANHLDWTGREFPIALAAAGPDGYQGQ